MALQLITTNKQMNSIMTTPFNPTIAAEAARQSLRDKGYAIVENVLSTEQVNELHTSVHDWMNKVPNLKSRHAVVDSHGIFKFAEVGAQGFMWKMRTYVAPFWRAFHKTPDVVTSLDGACWIPQNFDGKDRNWTHTDQSIADSTAQCVQGLVALTTNEERTLVVYPESQKYHAEYGKTVTDSKKRKRSFLRIDQSFLDRLDTEHGIKPIALRIPAGALALWDSRVFHQNRYGKPRSEERLVLYVCMLPRSGKKNTAAMRAKRRRYVLDRRTTSHWPYPIKVNGKQPNLRRYPDARIDYSALPAPTNLPSEDKIVELL